MATPSTAAIRSASPDAGSGGLYTAAAGTSLPTSAAASIAAFTDLGYVDEVSLTLDESVVSITAWGGDIVRRLQESHSASLTFTMLETTADTLKLAFGADKYTATTDGHKVEISKGNREAMCMLIDAIDGDWGIRLAAGNAVVTNLAEIPLTHTDALKYQVTVDLLPDANGVKATIYIEDVSA